MSVALLIAGIALLGGCGAVGRSLLDESVRRRLSAASPLFPAGILAVNATGSFAVGVLAGLAVGEDASRLLATAAVGSFTTFSTWMVETERLAERGRVELAAANIVVSLLLGLLAVWAGRELGHTL